MYFPADRGHSLTVSLNELHYNRGGGNIDHRKCQYSKVQGHFDNNQIA